MHKNTLSLSDVANVIDTFGIIRLQSCAELVRWTQMKGEVSQAYVELLERARQDLVINSSVWNEEELKMKFISPVIAASEPEVPRQIQVFYERPLTGKLHDYGFSVICDCIVARPTQGGRPQQPYFFLQEFEKEKGDRNDPEAQMLVAMLLSQQVNADDKPIYGAWLQGEHWYFCVLNGLEYCRSKTYLATEPDQLEKIVFMLQSLKTLILQR